jgi:palmitoyltransferase
MLNTYVLSSTLYLLALTPLQHVKKEPRPDPTQQYSRPSWDSDEIERGVIAGPRYVPQNSPSAAISPERGRNRSNPGDRETDTERTLSGPSSPRKTEGVSDNMRSDASTPSPREARPADALPKALPPKNATSKVATAAHPHQPPTTHGRENVTDPPPLTQSASAWFSRAPPQHGVLLPEYRYCSREGFVKPLRAHHCRSCGKVSFQTSCFLFHISMLMDEKPVCTTIRPSLSV